MSHLAGRAAAALALFGLVAVASTSRLDGGGRLVSSPAGYVVLGIAGVAVLAVVLFWLSLGGFAALVDMGRSTRLMLFGTLGAVLLAAGALLFLPRYPAEARPWRVRRARAQVGRATRRSRSLSQRVLPSSC